MTMLRSFCVQVLHSSGPELGLGSVMANGAWATPKLRLKWIQIPLEEVFWGLWTENAGTPKMQIRP